MTAATEAHKTPQTQQACSNTSQSTLPASKKSCPDHRTTVSLGYPPSECPRITAALFTSEVICSRGNTSECFKVSDCILSGKLHGSPYKVSAPLPLCRQQKEGLESCSQAGKLCLPCCCVPLGQELQVLMPPPCQHYLWSQSGLALLLYTRVPATENGGEETRDRIKNIKLTRKLLLKLSNQSSCLLLLLCLLKALALELQRQKRSYSHTTWLAASAFTQVLGSAGDGEGGDAGGAPLDLCWSIMSLCL